MHRSSSIARRRHSRELGTHVRNACARTAANLSLAGRYLSLFPRLLPGAFRANAALALVVLMVNAATAARCQQLTVMRTTRPIVYSQVAPFNHHGPICSWRTTTVHVLVDITTSVQEKCLFIRIPKKKQLFSLPER